MTRLIFDIETLGTDCHSIITGFGLLSEDGVTFNACFLNGHDSIEKQEKDMLLTLRKDLQAIEKAVLVGHYIRRFDFPMIISRCLFHNLDVRPFMNIPMLDTWEIAKDYLLMPYGENNLEDLCHFLGIKKDVTVRGYDMQTLFLKACQGHKQSLTLLEHHCHDDCVATLAIFNRFKPLLGMGVS